MAETSNRSAAVDALVTGLQGSYNGLALLDFNRDGTISGEEIKVATQLAKSLGPIVLPPSIQKGVDDACASYRTASPEGKKVIDGQIDAFATQGLQFLKKPPSQTAVVEQARQAISGAQAVPFDNRNVAQHFLAEEGIIAEHLANRLGQALNDPRVAGVTKNLPDRVSGASAADVCPLLEKIPARTPDVPKESSRVLL